MLIELLLQGSHVSLCHTCQQELLRDTGCFAMAL
jgi:hypothetical protein